MAGVADALTPNIIVFWVAILNFLFTWGLIAIAVVFFGVLPAWEWITSSFYSTPDAES